MKKDTTSKANATLARVAAVRARFRNPQADALARLAQIAQRHHLKTGAQLLAERETQDAALEAAAPPAEPFFDTGTTPASLDAIECAARVYEYQQAIAEAKAERAALLVQKSDVSSRRLHALRAGGFRAARQLESEFWSVQNRLDALDEVLIWEADDEKPVAPRIYNPYAAILTDKAVFMSDYARAKVEQLATNYCA